MDFRQLPEVERGEAIEEFLVEQFKAMLFIPGDEPLPLERSFFDLGLTSLRLSELKQRLEERLDITIDATVLFNQPTVAALTVYLSEAVEK